MIEEPLSTMAADGLAIKGINSLDITLVGSD